MHLFVTLSAQYGPTHPNSGSPCLQGYLATRNASGSGYHGFWGGLGGVSASNQYFPQIHPNSSSTGTQTGYSNYAAGVNRYSAQNMSNSSGQEGHNWIGSHQYTPNGSYYSNFGLLLRLEDGGGNRKTYGLRFGNDETTAPTGGSPFEFTTTSGFYNYGATLYAGPDGKDAHFTGSSEPPEHGVAFGDGYTEDYDKPWELRRRLAFNTQKEFTHYYGMPKNPVTGNAWTRAELLDDDFEIGLNGRGSSIAYEYPSMWYIDCIPKEVPWDNNDGTVANAPSYEIFSASLDASGDLVDTVAEDGTLGGGNAISLRDRPRLGTLPEDATIQYVCMFIQTQRFRGGYKSQSNTMGYNRIGLYVLFTSDTG